MSETIHVDLKWKTIARRGVKREEVPPVDRSFNRESRSGQAMAEFLVGLVGIMLLVVGLQQISIISRNSFEAYANVRMQLAEQLTDPMADFSGEYLFVDTVSPGIDQKNYTADDRVVEGDDRFYTEGNGFLERVDYPTISDKLVEKGCDDPYSRLSDASFSVPSKSFSMYYAVDYREVETVPFLRKMLGRDTILLQRDGWMPAWDGLMEGVP